MAHVNIKQGQQARGVSSKLRLGRNVGKAVAKVEERKLRKVGNSVGVTIPVTILNDMDLKEGDTISFETNNDGIVLKRKDPIVTDEFMSLIQKVADENDAALKALVER